MYPDRTLWFPSSIKFWEFYHLQDMKLRSLKKTFGNKKIACDQSSRAFWPGTAKERDFMVKVDGHSQTSSTTRRESIYKTYYIISKKPLLARDREAKSQQTFSRDLV
ncbi:hypothetical protein JCM33374_g4498 [Metschnikowia sp. JCM 33374]|nr:hypothetical protein JCM33374_g4498 [Metschnikowia sp. JCM 33374]